MVNDKAGIRWVKNITIKHWLTEWGGGGVLMCETVCRTPNNTVQNQLISLLLVRCKRLLASWLFSLNAKTLRRSSLRSSVATSHFCTIARNRGIPAFSQLSSRQSATFKPVGLAHWLRWACWTARGWLKKGHCGLHTLIWLSLASDLLVHWERNAPNSTIPGWNVNGSGWSSRVIRVQRSRSSQYTSPELLLTERALGHGRTVAS